MKSLIQFLLHNQNQFASGGLLLMVVGGIAASLRKIPLILWRWIFNQTTMTMTIIDDSDAFLWFKYWYNEQEYANKSRRVDVFTRGNMMPKFTPAIGRHWMWRGYRPIMISFIRSEEKKTVSSYTAKRAEEFRLTTIGRNQQFLRSLIGDIRTSWFARYADVPTLFTWHIDKYWRMVTGYVPRPLDSVILPRGQKERIVADLSRFYADESWYASMGIPWHRGYLFYGPPGTGKTSLVTGLSAQFNARIYLLKLSEHSDSTLASAIGECADRSFVVLEDVDCVVTARGEAQTKSGSIDDLMPHVTLSGLLNVIDGLQAPHGIVFFLTTNFIEKLDFALLRPGRVDMKECITTATRDQKIEMFNKFFSCSAKQSAGFVVGCTATTMADFQEALMQERNRRIAEGINPKT